MCTSDIHSVYQNLISIYQVCTRYITTYAIYQVTVWYPGVTTYGFAPYWSSIPPLYCKYLVWTRHIPYIWWYVTGKEQTHLHTRYTQYMKGGVWSVLNKTHLLSHQYAYHRGCKTSLLYQVQIRCIYQSGCDIPNSYLVYTRLSVNLVYTWYTPIRLWYTNNVLCIYLVYNTIYYIYAWYIAGTSELSHMNVLKDLKPWF